RTDLQRRFLSVASRVRCERLLATAETAGATTRVRRPPDPDGARIHQPPPSLNLPKARLGSSGSGHGRDAVNLTPRTPLPHAEKLRHPRGKAIDRPVSPPHHARPATQPRLPLRACRWRG